MFRAIQIARYLKLMEQAGISRRQLLAGTRIESAQLSSPDYLISLGQYEAVISNIVRLSGDPGIAFTLGRSIKLRDFGLVGYAMISARNLGEATDVWMKYSNSLVGQYTRTSWSAGPEGHELSFFSPTSNSMLDRFETEDSIVRGITIVRELTGMEPSFRDISFSYPEPVHRARYEEVMKCPLRFDAPRTLVRFVAPAFDTPIKTTNEELFSICAEHCSKVMNLLPDAGLLLGRLRSLFLSRPGQLPDLDAAAAALGMSASTLRRKLEADGHSYQSIKDDFRFDLAREYLRSGHMSPKQVAYLLGFNSPSNFSRAFKTWSGATVGQFLQQENER